MSDQKYEFVTIYSGKNSITYLASEFEELGEDATPYAIRQNPSENAPFHKFTLAESDAIQMWYDPKTQTASSGKWDEDALKQLLETNEDNS